MDGRDKASREKAARRRTPGPTSFPQAPERTLCRRDPRRGPASTSDRAARRACGAAAGAGRVAAGAAVRGRGGVGLEQPLARDPGRGGLLGLPPDQAAAQRGGEAENGERPAPARPRRQREQAEHRAAGEQQEGGPWRPVGQPEPGGDAEDQADREPERQLARARPRTRRFESRGRARRRASRPGTRLAPWWRRFRYARGARVTGRHAPILGVRRVSASEVVTRFAPSPDRLPAYRRRPHRACSTGSTRAIMAASSCCGSRIPTRRARPRRRSTRSSTGCAGSASTGTARPISSPNSPPATPRSRTSCSRAATPIAAG